MNKLNVEELLRNYYKADVFIKSSDATVDALNRQFAEVTASEIRNGGTISAEAATEAYDLKMQLAAHEQTLEEQRGHLRGLAGIIKNVMATLQVTKITCVLPEGDDTSNVVAFWVADDGTVTYS